MASWGKITRRTLLVGAAAVAGGFAVGYYKYQQEFPNPLANTLADGEATLNPYVKIASDGGISIMAPRAEMGQGISTTLAALVAEELGVSLASVKVEHGPASAAYFNRAMLENGAPFPEFDHSWGASSMRNTMAVVAKFLAIQATGGSSSTIDAFDKMRVAGATARQMLISAAAAKLKLDAATLKIDGGKITDGKQAVSIGDVAAEAAKLPVPQNVKLKAPSEWTILGKPQRRVDMLAKVTGAPIFGIDVVLPDMVFATVRMNPKLFGKLVSFDDAKARKVEGVTDVVQLKTNFGEGLAVIATNTWSAFKGAAALDIKWGEAPYPANFDEMKALYQATLDSDKASTMRKVGDAPAAIAAAAKGTVLEAHYSVPFLAHATMEPMNATARFKDGVMEVWSPNQAPTVVQSLCATVAGIASEKCVVHTTMMGGGFGRRGECDFSVYAAHVAMATKGKPVKVTWTREEDMSHDMYRPMAKARMRATLSDKGEVLALHGKIVAPSIQRSLLKRTFPSIPGGGDDLATTDGAFNQPYDFANFQMDSAEVPLEVPVGFWRSVGNSCNAFFFQCFLDEVAHAAKQDPMAFHLNLTKNHLTANKAIARVAEMSKWGAPPEKGKAKGFAFTLAFGGWVAQVVEVMDTPDGIKITKLWAAADVGKAIDPDIIKAQVMSGAIYGLSSAMNGEITFKDGMVEQTNFYDYPVMRMWQAPEFEIEILENAERMGGAGEIGTPPAVAALVNAVYALTGKRVHNLPLSREVKFA